ncbi:MAG: pilus assembly protein [Alphaproteobacteria bacterium]|nr:pilus assembly protein [Alphaproteobacteria bacterium]
MRINPTQKGSSILEFIVILPILFSFLVVFIDLAIIFYKQSHLDNALFGLHDKITNEDPISTIQDKLKLQGFKQKNLILTPKDGLIIVNYKQAFLTPFISTLMNKDYIELTSFISLPDAAIIN